MTDLPTGHPPVPEVRARIARLIEEELLEILFQPIVDLRTGTVAGYEALARPRPESSFDGPGELFASAEAVGLTNEVEGIARRLALRSAEDWADRAHLFLNNSPLVLLGQSFVEAIASEIEASAVARDQVVLEITERTNESVLDPLGGRAQVLRQLGFQIALDDVGAGISGLNQIMAIRPNWIKLDRDLIAGIELDPLKQNMMRLFVQFTRLSNMNLVAEGIEREEELEWLVLLGVTHGQGFLLARPGQVDPEREQGIKRRVVDMHERIASRRGRTVGAVRLSSLARPVRVCERTEPVRSLRDEVGLNSARDGVVVLDGRRYVGWVDAADWQGADDALPIGSLPVRPAPLVGRDITVLEGLEVIASRDPSDQLLPLILQQEGAARGVVTLRDLLLAVVEANRETHAHQSPLMGLPSRVDADRWIADQIRTGVPYHTAFIDLRDFDAYNIAYGTEMGDAMLLRLVGLARSTVLDEDRDGSAILAHLGEDRFFLGMHDDRRARLAGLIDAFRGIVSEFFTAVDVDGGCYTYLDPAGRRRTLPLTSVRVVLLDSVLSKVTVPRQLYDQARRVRAGESGDADWCDTAILTDRRTPTEQHRSVA